MQKERAIALLHAAENVAATFSDPNRGGNVLAETYKVDGINVLGETTAAVVFIKSPTGKKAVAYFYYLNSRAKPRWEYFFITYAHLASLTKVADLLHSVEQHNFNMSTAVA